ncbi:MAG: cyclase family protein [Gemmatimonadetes bacterium]|nr:cyclase family protein [Gemmatimonadota bacterium]
MSRWRAIATWLCAPMLAGAQPLDLARYHLIDLTHEVSERGPAWPGSRVPFKLDTLTATATTAMFRLQLNEHFGTHLDAPRHAAGAGWTNEQIPLDRLVVPVVVIDVTRQAANTRDYALTPADVAAHEAQHGRIPRGSAVVLWTGWARYWETTALLWCRDHRSPHGAPLSVVWDRGRAPADRRARRRNPRRGFALNRHRRGPILRRPRDPGRRQRPRPRKPGRPLERPGHGRYTHRTAHQDHRRVRWPRARGGPRASLGATAQPARPGAPHTTDPDKVSTRPALTHPAGLASDGVRRDVPATDRYIPEDPMRSTLLAPLAALVVVASTASAQNPPPRCDRMPCDRMEDVRDRREDRRDRAEDRRDRKEDVRDRREDVRDRREDVRDAMHNGGRRDRLEDVRDRREDVRDRREDVRDRREDVRDRAENRRDRREDRRDRRP